MNSPQTHHSKREDFSPRSKENGWGEGQNDTIFYDRIDSIYTTVTTPDTFLVLVDTSVLQPGKIYQWSVAAADSQFTTQCVNAWSFSTGSPVFLKENGIRTPRQFSLKQNYPNPFNPSTTIELSLPQSGFVTLKIYNILGEEVATLVSERLAAGKYKYDWDARGWASGVYYYRLETYTGFGQTQKMILLK